MCIKEINIHIYLGLIFLCCLTEIFQAFFFVYYFTLVTLFFATKTIAITLMTCRLFHKFNLICYLFIILVFFWILFHWYIIWFLSFSHRWTIIVNDILHVCTTFYLFNKQIPGVFIAALCTVCLFFLSRTQSVMRARTRAAMVTSRHFSLYIALFLYLLIISVQIICFYISIDERRWVQKVLVRQVRPIRS